MVNLCAQQVQMCKHTNNENVGKNLTNATKMLQIKMAVNTEKRNKTLQKPKQIQAKKAAML